MFSLFIFRKSFSSLPGYYLSIILFDIDQLICEMFLTPNFFISCIKIDGNLKIVDLCDCIFDDLSQNVGGWCHSNGSFAPWHSSEWWFPAAIGWPLQRATKREAIFSIILNTFRFPSHSLILLLSTNNILLFFSVVVIYVFHFQLICNVLLLKWIQFIFFRLYS